MLPNDPPDDNKQSLPSDEVKPPPPFGSHFDPHSNSVDPNNPYHTQLPPSQTPPSESPNTPNIPNHPTHSDVAQRRLRDEHGHFLSFDNQSTPQLPPNSQTTSLPPLIQTNPKSDTKDEDPPLIKVTNPVTYLKRWWKKIMANEGIDIGFKFKLKPVTAVIITTLILSNGVTFGVTYSFVKIFFPNSSPILHRQIINQGTIQKNAQGIYYLIVADSSLWKLKVKNTNINLSNLVGKQVIVTGNLTKEKNLIEVSEVIISEQESKSPPNSTPIPNSPTSPNLPNILNQDLLPKLYSGLQWDLTQRKVLIFTSGRRKIEQEGVYMESAQITTYPQDFVDYYTAQLTNSGFKETLNLSDPNGTTITYAKDDLFLTFGVKNIYSGSGDNKKLSGYKAFIEHN